MPNGQRNPHVAQVIPNPKCEFGSGSSWIPPQRRNQVPAQAAPQGAEKNNDSEDGENAEVFEEAARRWLERADAVAFAQRLFYQPLTATVVRQETDPIRLGRPGLRAATRWFVAGGDCPDPFRFWVLNRFWHWRSVTKTLLKSCQKLPLCATQRSDPQWVSRPISVLDPKSFLGFEIGYETPLKSCQKLPLCATQRSDPRWVSRPVSVLDLKSFLGLEIGDEDRSTSITLG